MPNKTMPKKRDTSRNTPSIIPITKQSTHNAGALRLYYPTDVVEDNEFKTLLPERNTEELVSLEDSLLKSGIEIPMDIWHHEGERILVDGYSRLKIAKKHNLTFQIRIRDFKSREEVKIWIISHQLERRNVTTTEKAFLIGFEYHRLKKNPEFLPHENEHSEVTGQNVQRVQQSDNQEITNTGQNVQPDEWVSVRLGKLHNISEKTVRRNERVFLGLSYIRKHNDQLGLIIAAEKTSVTMSDLEILAQMEEMPEVTKETKPEDIKAVIRAKPKSVKKKQFLPNLNKNWQRTLSLVGRYDKDPSKAKTKKEALESIEQILTELIALQQRIKHGE